MPNNNRCWNFAAQQYMLDAVDQASRQPTSPINDYLVVTDLDISTISIPEAMPIWQVPPQSPIAIASGFKQAQTGTTVIVVTSDQYWAETLTTDAAYIPHPMVVIVHNLHQRPTLSQPQQPSLAAMLAVNGYPWIARSLLSETEQAAMLINQAASQKTIAVVEIVQPCNNPEHDHSIQWYRAKQADITSPATSLAKALPLLQSDLDTLPVGHLLRR